MTNALFTKCVLQENGEDVCADGIRPRLVNDLCLSESSGYLTVTKEEGTVPAVHFIEMYESIKYLSSL